MLSVLFTRQKKNLNFQVCMHSVSNYLNYNEIDLFAIDFFLFNQFICARLSDISYVFVSGKQDFFENLPLYFLGGCVSWGSLR